MGSSGVPGKVKDLVDQLGKALVEAIATSETGHGLLRQIQETGFDVGILLEATVALHSKEDGDDPEGACPFYFAGEDENAAADGGGTGDFKWSDEDKAIMCNFRISLD